MSRAFLISMVLAGSTFASSTVLGQNADESDTRASASIRLGWLLSTGEGYVDRPVVEGSLGYNLVQPRERRPGLALTGSGGVAIGEAFAESTLWTFRAALGLEPMFFVGPSVQFVPFVQAGYLTSVKDERSGLYSRVGIGFRVITSKSFRYSFDPVSFTVLPLPDLSEESASRYGVEIGVIRAVWQF